MQAEFCSHSLGMVVKDVESQYGQIKPNSIVQGVCLWCLSFLVISIFLPDNGFSTMHSQWVQYCPQAGRLVLGGLEKPQIVFGIKKATIYIHKQTYSISVVFKFHGEGNGHEDAQTHSLRYDKRLSFQSPALAFLSLEQNFAFSIGSKTLSF